MPDLAAIQNESAALGVQVIGASTDEIGDRQKILQFVKEEKINFPIWIGAGTSDMLRFGLRSAQREKGFIDKEGQIAKVISGLVTQAELKRQIDSMQAANISEPASRVTNGRVASAKEPVEVSSVPS